MITPQPSTFLRVIVKGRPYGLVFLEIFTVFFFSKWSLRSPSMPLSGSMQAA